MEIVIRKIDSREKKNRTNGKAIAGQISAPERRLSWRFNILVPQSIVFLSLNLAFSLPPI